MGRSEVFRARLDDVTDFRVVFDYFFPGLIPGSPVEIPPAIVGTWESYYTSTVVPVLTAPGERETKRDAASMTVTGVPHIPGDPTTAADGISTELWYNVKATNDATAKLGGQPFDN